MKLTLRTRADKPSRNSILDVRTIFKEIEKEEEKLFEHRKRMALSAGHILEKIFS